MEAAVIRLAGDAQHQLQIAHTTKLIEIQTIGQIDAQSGEVRQVFLIEGDVIELGIVISAQIQFEMALTDNALMGDFEYAFEDRLREILPPRACATQLVSEFEFQLCRIEAAIAVYDTVQIIGAQMAGLPRHQRVPGKPGNRVQPVFGSEQEL